jgi:hypothetical protein
MCVKQYPGRSGRSSGGSIHRRMRAPYVQQPDIGETGTPQPRGRRPGGTPYMLSAETRRTHRRYANQTVELVPDAVEARPDYRPGCLRAQPSWQISAFHGTGRRCAPPLTRPLAPPPPERGLGRRSRRQGGAGLELALRHMPGAAGPRPNRPGHTATGSTTCPQQPERTDVPSTPTRSTIRKYQRSINQSGRRAGLISQSQQI